MNAEAAAFAEMFSQLGSISAVLGGFAFASAGALLAASEERAGRAAAVAVGAAVLSAACFILSALSWTLSTVRATGAASIGDGLPASLFSIHAVMSLVFEVGVLALFVSLGASGWVRSPRLGWFTAGAALVAAVAATVIVFQFVA